MNPQYEVTIGIPVFRSARYVECSLMSALNQSFTEIEFLIIDDCGEDGSMDIVKRIKRSHPRGENIHILKNEFNMGVSYSRNRIIDEARGRYLYFMDSDDTIESNTIQLLYNAIKAHKVQIAYGSYEIVDGINNSPKEVYQKDALMFKGEDKLAFYAFKYNRKFQVSACNHLVDVEFLRDSKIRFVEASFWEDMAYTTELVTIITSAVLLPDITYHYLRHLDSLSHYLKRVQYNKKEISDNISILDFLKEKCLRLKGKVYMPFLCYNLGMNSFYLACYILKRKNCIYPGFSWRELKHVVQHPLGVKDIFRFRYKLISNIGIYILGKIPNPFFNFSLWLLGKIKHAI